MNTQSKNTICLWYDKDALTAAEFYAATFPDSTVGAVFHAPSDFPDGRAGQVLTVEFSVIGIPCMGMKLPGAKPYPHFASLHSAGYLSVLRPKFIEN